MSCFEESSGIDEGRSNELIAAVQTPDNPSILNKRSIAETESMDVMKAFHIKRSKHTPKMIRFQKK